MRDQRARRHAVALLMKQQRACGCFSELRARRWPRRPLAQTGRATAENFAGLVGGYGRAGVARRDQGRDRRGADALGPRFADDLLLPGVKPLAECRTRGVSV